MKVFSFFIILIVSIILSSKTESEACVWTNWFCDWITGRNNDREATTTPSTGISTTELVVTTNKPTTPAIPENEKKEAMDRVSSSIIGLADYLDWNLLKRSRRGFIISPLSAVMLFMMAFFGMNIKEEYEEDPVLLFNTDDIFKTGIHLLIEIFDALNPIELELANKIYVGKNQDINPDFKSLVSEMFRSSIENVDFGLSENTAEKIDTWRAEKSRRRISNVIKPDKISADTEFLFTNSLHFSALWKEPFNETNTKLVKFNTSDGKTIEQPIMYRNMTMSNSSSYHLELQKRDSNDYSYGVNIANYFDSDKFKKHLALPKLKIENIIYMDDIFDERRTSNFHNHFLGISKQSSVLNMNKVAQKLTLEINELGIEAAVYSEASFTSKGGYSVPPLKQDPIFNEYSFLLSIEYAKTMLFTALYVNDDDLDKV